MRMLSVLAAALLACAVSTPAQQPAPKADLSVEARLVIVSAVVRDKKGALVGSLQKDAFALSVDGKPQSIRYFDHDTNVPLTVGLLIDTSMSQRKVLDEEREASVAFLDKMLTPDRDKAFIVQFARAVDMLQDVTTSRPKLQKALKEVEADDRPQMQRPDDNDNADTNGRGRGGAGRRGFGGTALYDAVFLSADEVVARQKGRSALILLTDGDDRGSKVSLARAIEAAQHANTIVYAIYYKGEEPSDRRPGGFGRGNGPFGGGRRGGFPLAGGGQWGGGQRGGNQVDGRKVLERICGETGGRVFEVSHKQNVESIYTQIAEELRTQYRIGFTPADGAADEGYHQITLTLSGQEARSKDTIQTRDGFYSAAK